MPRENPRAWIRSSTEEQPLKTNPHKSPVLEKSIYECEIGIDNANSKDKTGASPAAKLNLNFNCTLNYNSSQEENLLDRFLSFQVDEDSTLYAHDIDVQPIMPKLQCADYYTKPPIHELAAKERAEPGFCRQVKDLVVRKHDCGSIKFLGETDVTKLDLESLICFNCREVIVYKDESKKPPVGLGLNKPAEITLLNVKCIDKNTGKQYTGGAMVDKHKQMLMKKAADQGAEYVSYDPVLGECKFRVRHF